MARGLNTITRGIPDPTGATQRAIRALDEALNQDETRISTLEETVNNLTTGVGAVNSVTGTAPITAAPTAGNVVVSLDDDGVSNAKLRNSAATSVIGRSAGSAGDPADIAASADGDVLRRAGGALGFGAIPESSVTNLVADLAARPTGSGTATRTVRWTSSTDLGTGAMADDTVNVGGVSDDSFFGWDAGQQRIGFTKKAGFVGKLTYGSANSFAIAQSNTATIIASSTYTDRLTIDSTTLTVSVSSDFARGSSANGTVIFRGTTHNSHFNFPTTGSIEETFIRGGKTGSSVLLNDSHNGNVAAVAGGGLFGIGTNTPRGELSVASANTGVGFSIAAWDNKYSIFGPNAGSTTGAALALGYSTNDNAANIVSLQPGTAWRKLRLACNALDFNSTASVRAGGFDTAGAFDTVGNATLGSVPGTNTHIVNGVTTVIRDALVAGFQAGIVPLVIRENGNQQINLGAGIQFEGAFNGTATTHGALIKMMKTNGTAANYSFDLAFGTRLSGDSDPKEHFRIKDTGAIQMGDVGSSTVSDNVDVLTIGNTGTGQTTGSKALIRASHTGSLNTTSSPLESWGIASDATASRSAGANSLFNIAFRANAANGQVNYSFYGLAGDMYNAGNLQIDGSSTLGNASSDVVLVTGKIGATFTPSAQTSSVTSFNFLNNGTYDTTSSNLTAQSVKAECTVTKSGADGNILTNRAFVATATGGSVNQAIYTLDGDCEFNTNSGTSNFHGGAALGDASGDSSYVNGNLTFQNPPTAGSIKYGSLQARIFIKQQAFTAGGTYTPSTNAKACRLRMVGGGGGGGGWFDGINGGCGGGGAAGEYVEIWIDANSNLSGGTVTIGAAGAGGNNGTGGTGGDTSVVINGTTYTARGGLGGVKAGAAAQIVAAGGAGQAHTGTAGDIQHQQTGKAGIYLTNGGYGGEGGSSPFGAGGGEQTGTANGNAGTGYGAGGGGSQDRTAAANKTGAGGTAGFVLIEEFA